MPMLDPAVANAARTRWPERGPAWITALPAEQARLCEDLGVTLTGRAFRARFAYVVEATTPAGARLVLRSSPDPGAVHQAAVLAHLACVELAPAVHLTRETPASTWTAMDAVEPGTSFADDTLSADELTTNAAMLRTLAAETIGPSSVPSIIPWLRGRLTDPPADDQPPHRGPEPEDVRQAAVAILDQLAADAPAALCHGDLSPPNILCGRSRLWYIDPRGVNGEAAYDVAVLALKSTQDNLGAARILADTLARRSGNDPDRATAWTTIADAATV